MKKRGQADFVFTCPIVNDLAGIFGIYAEKVDTATLKLGTWNADIFRIADDSNAEATPTRSFTIDVVTSYSAPP